MSFFDEDSPANMLQKALNQLGATRLDYVEIDVLLTVLLQRLHEVGFMDKVVFKGGTMLRKVLFGKNGRLSTDLDFTVLSLEFAPDDIALEI